jgi:hypothetical protein
MLHHRSGATVALRQRIRLQHLERLLDGGDELLPDLSSSSVVAFLRRLFGTVSSAALLELRPMSWSPAITTLGARGTFASELGLQSGRGFGVARVTAPRRSGAGSRALSRTPPFLRAASAAADRRQRSLIAFSSPAELAERVDHAEPAARRLPG